MSSKRITPDSIDDFRNNVLSMFAEKGIEPPRPDTPMEKILYGKWLAGKKVKK